MSNIEWRLEYNTGVSSMDLQHHKLVELLDLLHKKIGHTQNDYHTDLDYILNELLCYAKVHFHDEEELLKRFFYPGIQDHIAKHGELVAQLADNVEAYGNGNLSAVKLACFVKNWILNHIIEEDKKYGIFLLEKWGKCI